jgi:hypothetical protein
MMTMRRLALLPAAGLAGGQHAYIRWLQPKDEANNAEQNQQPVQANPAPGVNAATVTAPSALQRTADKGANLDELK